MKELSVRAYYVGNELKIAEIDKKTETQPLIRKRDFLVYELAPETYVFAYTFGVWVFIGYDSKLEKAYIKKYNRFIGEPQEKQLIEEYLVALDETIEKESVEFDKIKLRTLEMEKILLLAEVLAQSVAMDYFDSLSDEMGSRLEKVNVGLAGKGRLLAKPKEIARLIASNNRILQLIISRLSILDAPEVVWEKEEYDRLYTSLRSQFDLDDRFKTIEAKLGFIQNNSEFFLGLLQGRRSERLEITILIVIIFETLLVLLEVFRL